jgi:histone deacetylase 6
VHHGDGTYSLISGESEILFVSLHRYDNGFFYPGKSGNPQNIGKGAGIGSKINIAWNTDTYEDNAPGDDEYIYAFERIVIPVLREFVPDLILVSCGFDAARDDPLGGCSIGPDGYAYLTTRL